MSSLDSKLASAFAEGLLKTGGGFVETEQNKAMLKQLAKFPAHANAANKPAARSSKNPEPATMWKRSAPVSSVLKPNATAPSGLDATTATRPRTTARASNIELPQRSTVTTSTSPSATTPPRPSTVPPPRPSTAPPPRPTSAATVVPPRENAKLPDATLVGRLGTWIRYERANYHPTHNPQGERINQKTTVRLTDVKSAYPANHVKFTQNGRSYIVVESPKGSDVEKNHATGITERLTGPKDNTYYYEMAWNENPRALISAVSFYDRKNPGILDKERFDFLSVGDKPLEVKMTNGKTLVVKCTALEDAGLFEKRTLELKVDNETRTIEQWMPREVFSYGKNGEGLEAAKILYEKVIKGQRTEATFIVNCVTGKDRSAALLMWLHLLENPIPPKELTMEYLLELAQKFEEQTIKGGLVDHIKETLIYKDNFDSIEAVQEAYARILNELKR